MEDTTGHDLCLAGIVGDGEFLCHALLCLSKTGQQFGPLGKRLVRLSAEYPVKAALVSFLLCLGLSAGGCGFASKGTYAGDSNLAPSHAAVLETAVEIAFDSMKVPEGRGTVIDSVQVENGGVLYDMIRAQAIESLAERGYTIKGKTDGGSTFSVTVDSLTVILSSPKKKDRNNVSRMAHVVVSAEITSSGGLRSVYRGTGVYKDSINRQFIETASAGEPYVHDERTGGWFALYLKPLVIGATMTIFTWALYSYRG